MLVTDKKFYMERYLIAKLDMMVKRMEGTDDNVVCIDGDEGQGKTNLAAGLCYYISSKTGRTYTPKESIFFNLDELIEVAAKGKDLILHWDEGALGGMSMQWWNKNQQKFIQLLMIARKKRHFIVICIPRFYKLNEYILVDRSIALLHVYSRNNIHKGRFCYYTKRNKERLVEDWRRKHVKNYKRHKSFWGTFPEYMDKFIFNKEQLKEYDKKKDNAIESITIKAEKRDTIMEKRIQRLVKAMEMFPKLKRSEQAELLGVSEETIRRDIRTPYFLTVQQSTLNINKGVLEPNNPKFDGIEKKQKGGNN